MGRPYPELLTSEEDKALLETAERIWRELQANQLGGFSGINRPFWILAEFKAAIEKYGHRDIGQTWSKNELDAAKAERDGKPTSLLGRFLSTIATDRLCQCPPPFIPQRNGTCGVCARPER